ncbi:hypothetical protein [Sorangium sp. So ce854]|uniref:DUF4351 domain-containing protein n=1 Tax=Sorangium cellulosum TaxID=56 RepID=A0A150PTR0_SORCE|nr:hypothetical protein BE08_28610 [Sorangium cellulosum]
MGQPDQFAKTTFAEETERITGGAARWEDPPEIRLEKVQCDGFLVISRPDRLAHLPAPWSETRTSDEVVIELKLAGDHVDRLAAERALLRRQARQVQRAEEQGPSWVGDEPLWLVAAHLPVWLERTRKPVRFAPGCYRVEPLGHLFLWIAANELPLRDDLVPFLVARSGRALDEFARWVAPRRSPRWVLGMLRYLAMSTSVRKELLWGFEKTDDPEILARDQEIFEVLLAARPHLVERVVEEGRREGRREGHREGRREGHLEGRLIEARAALRRVLARRELKLSPEDEARIEACGDLATIERWHEQAVTATSTSEALQ